MGNAGYISSKGVIGFSTTIPKSRYLSTEVQGLLFFFVIAHDC